MVTAKKKRRPAQHGRTAAPRIVAAAEALPWSVSPELIVRLDDAGLNRLMRELLLSEAYRCGADRMQVVTNTQTKAADEGADAETPAPTATSTWLGDAPTCWQFKAGSAAAPNKLKGEAAKPRPVAMLQSGGRFVLVASAATSGPAGIASRKKVLVKDARRKRAPTNRIEVLTSEILSVWVNEHPPVAFGLRGLPRSLCTLGEWASHPHHADAWTPSPGRQARLEQLQRAFETTGPGAFNHVHISGRAGVGKTRLALEACKTAPWQSQVLYAPDASDQRVRELIDGVAQGAGARVVLVVDEAQSDQVKALGFACQRAAGRVRLVTIGHDPSPDRERIEDIEVEPLEDEVMTKAVQAWHPKMAREHVSYVVAIADGFVRLARMIAFAVAKNPDLDTATLLRQGDIKQLLDGMLGNAETRRSLHVVALLTNVGWRGQRAEEGRAIADHLGLDWTAVQAEVQRFHDLFGIAPMAGDLRYISPSPLGVFLTLEAWDAYADRIRTLPAALPNDQARHAFNDRLRAVVASPNAKEFAEQELSFFFRWQHFADPTAVDRWAAMTGANPRLAASHVRKAVQGATEAERRQIVGPARRHLVNALVDLAWQPEAFFDAVLALAELAVAENEGWANNATGEFANRYQLFLAKTACPYSERLLVVDELLTNGTPAHHRLVIGALARLGEQHEFSWGSAPAVHALPTQQWHPHTEEEQVASVVAALDRLQQAASLPGVDEALARAAGKLVILLREQHFRNAVAAFLRVAAGTYPALREGIRREIRQVLRAERKYWKTLSEADVAWLEAVHAEFEDRSDRGRLRRITSETPWERDGDASELTAFAQELIRDPSPLWAEWEWVTSGEAVGAWDLGDALGRADDAGVLLSKMASAPGRGQDPRVISAYFAGRSTKQPPGWIDDRLDAYETEHPDDVTLLFDVTWRCCATSHGAERLARLVHEGQLPPGIAASLSHGGWTSGPDIASLRRLLDTLLARDADRSAILELVEHRLGKHPEDLTALQDVALTLVADPALIRRGHMTSYYWDQLAQRLMSTHAREIARAIFAAQMRKGEDVWFIHHSEAAKTLDACVRANPEAAWEELAPYLQDALPAHMFSVGFPHGILSQMPHAAVLKWVEVDPPVRANAVARMTSKYFGDESLGAKVLDRFGGVKGVGDTFFSAFMTGGWVGEASQHWAQLAERLDTTAKQSKLAGVRKWAREGATSLRRMALADRKREEERKVRFE